MPTLGDFIGENERGTKALQKEGAGSAGFRDWVSTVFFPFNPADREGGLAVGDELIGVLSGDLVDFYKSLRFKTAEEVNVPFIPSGSSSVLTQFWDPNRNSGLKDAYNQEPGNNETLNTHLGHLFVDYQDTGPSESLDRFKTVKILIRVISTNWPPL